jgi:hypothetical protein
MKRTSKRYVVTTSALNCYLFRIITLGVDISQYEKNPVMLWMHMRARGLNKDEILPLGRCVELKIEGDAITCYLEFDETDDFAMRIYNKYENGTLNMISAGIKPLEWSEEPEEMLPGQYGPTITKGKLVEVSCVDIGANDDSLPVTLYDSDDNIIKLSDMAGDGLVKLFNTLKISHTPDNQNMKILTLSAPAASAILLQLKLAETATEVEIQQKVTELVTLSFNQSNEIVKLQGEVTAAGLKVTEAEGKLADAEKEGNTKKITDMVQLAADQGKILPVLIPQFVTLAGKDFEGTKAVLDGLPASGSVAETLKKKDGEGAWYAKLSYDELDKSGQLIKLKGENLEVFKAKFLEKHKTEYKGA